MTTKDRIVDLLERSRTPYCDDCLSSSLSIRPRQQVQQKTAELAKNFRFVRAPGTCSRCKSDKLVIHAKAA